MKLRKLLCYVGIHEMKDYCIEMGTNRVIGFKRVEKCLTCGKSKLKQAK